MLPAMVRVRFAPSPTGHLHVGGARTAIFNWLFARHHGGRFILRIEDTDVARSTRESEQMVLDDLLWLGLQWDEGPFRQSERTEMYRQKAEELIASGKAYHCFCTEEELERKRKVAEAAGRPPHYDLTCYRLPPPFPQRPYAIRFHVGEDADVTIQDQIRGQVTWKKESLGDFIILRSDGMPTYNFSVVVDDHDMKITHVIRAEEHLTNTHRQVLIYRAFGWPVTEFAHVSLILAQDRTKLSKRHGATSVNAYAEVGYLPDAMFNYLTLLGWSPPDGKEIFSREEAIRQFSLERVNPAPAVFDPQKFAWMNSQYIHAATPAELRPHLVERLQRRGWLQDSSDATLWLDEAIDLIRKGVEKLDDFIPALAFAFEFDPGKVVADAECRAVLSSDGTREMLGILVEELRKSVPRSSEEFHAFVDRLKERSGRKGKTLLQPMRIAIMGALHGPELQKAVPLLQKGSETAGLAPIVPPAERVQQLLARL